jgi:hypothetical protein
MAGALASSTHRSHAFDVSPDFLFVRSEIRGLRRRRAAGQNAGEKHGQTGHPHSCPRCSIHQVQTYSLAAPSVSEGTNTLLAHCDSTFAGNTSAVAFVPNSQMRFNVGID